MNAKTKTLCVLLVCLLSVAAQGAINPFEYKRTASICALATLIDFQATAHGGSTQLRYEVRVDEVIWIDSDLERGATLVIKYQRSEPKKPGLLEKLFWRPRPGPQPLYDPELSFFENDQAVLFLDRIEAEGEVFYTPASNQYSSEPPDSADYLRRYAAERK